MRSLRRDKRAISPIIATILLIAVTAVAAGVIAAYAAGLFVSNPRLTICTISAASVYDWDNTAAKENYKNGVVGISVRVESGSTLRNIADPSYGGTSVTVTNPATGFTATASFSGVDNWGTTGYTNSHNITVSSWTGACVEYVTMIVTMNPDTTGKLTSGSSIGIILQPFGVADAHQRENTGFGGGSAAVFTARRDNAKMWDEKDTFNVVINSRDSVSLTGYEGAYLGGVTWTVT